MTSRDDALQAEHDLPRRWLLCIMSFVLGMWAAGGFLFWIGFASFDGLWGRLV
jgi:hypothetical protein